MWTDGSNDQSGGFLSSQYASPSDEGKKPVKRAQNIVPVTAYQILNSGDDIKIGEFEIHLVTVVGLIESIDVSSTKVTYTVSDDTATINAVLWLEGSVENNDVVENTYCRIFGAIRSHQGKRHIMIFKIKTLSSLNELTMHLLEVVECNLAAQDTKTEQQKVKLENTDFGLANSLMNTNVNNMNDAPFTVHSMDGLTAKQRMVLDIVRTTPGEVGPSKQQMAQMLAGKVSAKEIGDIVEFLSSEGHIYSTIDDDHYAFTS